MNIIKNLILPFTAIFFCTIAYILVDALDITKKFELKHENCKIVDGPRGFEDQTLWNKKVMISTQRDVSSEIKKDKSLKKNGGMYLITGFGEQNQDIKITQMKLNNWPEGLDFQPHGMDIENSERRAYVINHADKSERIEVFDVDVDKEDTPISLSYLYSIQSDELTKKSYSALNALTVVAPNIMYVTQWQDSKSLNFEHDNPLSIDKIVIRFFSGKGRPVYFLKYDRAKDQLSIEIASEDLSAPNGITKNTDGSEIYIADTFAKQIVVYKRNTITNKLTKFEMINPLNYLDNIKFDSETNSLHAGAITYGLGALLALKKFPRNSKHGVGGLVEYERNPINSNWQIKEHVITNMFNGISNSLRIGNTLVGGSFLDKGILVCQIAQTDKIDLSFKYQKTDL